MKGKVSDICSKCKNGKVVVWKGVSNIVCEDPYDGMIKTLTADSDICCSMFEMKPEKSCDKISLLQHELEMDKLRKKIHELEKEKADHLKGIERLKKSNNDLKGAYNHLLETIKNDNEAGSKIVEDNVTLEREKSELIKASKRKDELIQSYRDKSKNYEQILIDISRFVPVDVTDFKDLPTIIEQMRKAGDEYDSLSESCDDLLDQKYELQKANDKLEEKLKKANDLADSWQRDYEFVRDRLIHPIYDILYPGNLSRDINVTDLLNTIKNFKVYADENGSMYEEIKKLRDMYASRGNEIDHLLSENKEKDKKISELESSRDAWSNTATARAEQVIEAKKDRDKWRKLYNSLSETCADYDKRCKEECEKKYRDEISKLQNIVTEKHAEIKGLKKEIINLGFDRVTVKDVMNKNNKLKQTISDQEVTIKALLITIKEMCKECETNE